jgi:hypothetical protein
LLNHADIVCCVASRVWSAARHTCEVAEGFGPHAVIESVQTKQKHPRSDSGSESKSTHCTRGGSFSTSGGETARSTEALVELA